jgi:hypothetical protein
VVSFRHGFHLNDGKKEFDDLKIEDQRYKLEKFNLSDFMKMFIPPETQRTLAGLGCITKTTRTGFVVVTEVSNPSSDGPFLPARIPNSPLRLRFVFKVRESQFWNYTNIKLDGVGRAAYHVSNRVNQLNGSFPDLAEPPEVFTADKSYRMGDVVRAEPPSDIRYLAISAGINNSPAGEGDDNWHRIGKGNFVGEKDSVVIRSPMFSYPLPPNTIIDDVRLVALDGAVNQIEFTARSSHRQMEISIDASKLPSGRYILKMTGRDAESNDLSISNPIYLDPQFSTNDIFLIIELFHTPGEQPGKFHLYNEKENYALRQPEFIVRLLNRHTYWRYRFRTQLKADFKPGEQFEKVNGNYVTRHAMPLTRGIQKIVIGEGEGAMLLPNPSVNYIFPEQDRVYSDIHIHTNPISE